MDVEDEAASEDDGSLLPQEDQAFGTDGSVTSEETKISEHNEFEDSQDGTVSESDGSVSSKETPAFEP